jgi:SAM-dependent methyltransferase
MGIDLSPQMVLRARRLNPDIEFSTGDMTALDAADGAWGGILAFYSIVHIPRCDVVRALEEMRRALRPGGVLLLAFHIGEGALHRDELWEIKVCIDFVCFTSSEMTGYLESAGFKIEEVVERDPYPEVEYPSRRSYIWAINPGDISTRPPNGR